MPVLWLVNVVFDRPLYTDDPARKINIMFYSRLNGLILIIFGHSNFFLSLNAGSFLVLNFHSCPQLLHFVFASAWGLRRMLNMGGFLYLYSRLSAGLTWIAVKQPAVEISCCFFCWFWWVPLRWLPGIVFSA